MQALDATTLLMVNAVLNGFAAMAWCLLAGLFRIAPAASWLMAAGHVARVFSLRCVGCVPGLPAWAEEAVFALAGMATAALLVLALRRMLRLRQRWGDVAAITGVGVLGVLSLALMREHGPMPLLSALGIALLTLLATRDIIGGAGPGLSRGITALMALPYLLVGLLSLGRAGQLLLAPHYGLLAAADRRPSALMAALWLLLTTAITVSLIALLIWRLISRIEHLTRRDSMTRTLNRRAIAAEMRALQAHQERGHGFTVMIIDIDHFKRINDQHGHAAGDAALLHFVAVMRGCLRELDRLGRLGGEEFCALLPYTGLADAAQVAERMRAALAAQPLSWRGLSIAMTASFGVAPGQTGDPQGEASLAQADRQVYRAKAEGRNRVCVASDEALT